jgi:hypothetical protein
MEIRNHSTVQYYFHTHKKIFILFFYFINTCCSTFAQSNLPVISIVEGVLNFNGDVGYGHLNEPLTARTGFQIELQKHTEKRLSYSVFLLSGKIFGEERTPERALNFTSSILTEGIMLRYDFISNKKQQVLIPFITAGVEYAIFHPKADLKDRFGNTYHYWNDGSIKNIEQGDSSSSRVVQLFRDHVYETDLRDANIDGFGKFKLNSWGFPVGAGVRFRISNRCSMHFSSVCHILTTDHVDGITAEGNGYRKGNDRNDLFFYTSASFRFDIGAARETPKKKKRGGDYSNVDFTALGNEDADGDGIPDIRDDSSGTPSHNKVDGSGKPFDKDDDGIPDYRDLELNSAKDAVVTEEGVTITEAMIEEKFRQDSLSALPAVVEYLKSYDRLIERNPDAAKKYEVAESSGAVKTRIPNAYIPIDTDMNGVITPKEISLAIDDYLAKKSVYTVQQFFDLIDFFFSQR